MKVSQKPKYILLSLCLLPFSAACSTKIDPLSPRAPHYILSGTKVESEGESIYDFYELDSGEYAISLRDDIKATYNDPISLPDTYNGRKVSGVWRDAFRNCPASTITLTDSITVIDYEAFLGSSITSIRIPASVTSIGEAAFYGCKNLTIARFDNSNRDNSGSKALNTCAPASASEDSEDVIVSTLDKIPSFCFFNCTNLTELLLPSGIKIIDYEAFNGCSSIESTLSFNSLTTIRARAFQGCSSLTKIYIPESFFEPETGGIIEPHAFNYCNSASEMEIYFATTQEKINTWLEIGDNAKWGWYSDIGSPSTYSYSYIQSSSSTVIANDWTYTLTDDGKGGKDVTITGYIGPTADIDFLVIPNNLPLGTTGNKVREITNDALAPLKADLNRLYLPTTLYKINDNMFDGFQNLFIIDSNSGSSCTDDAAAKKSDDGLDPLSRIDLSDLKDLWYIGNNGFSGLTQREKIRAVHLPKKLKYVGNMAFCYVKNYTDDNAEVKWFRNVRDLKWDYDERCAQLEYVGHFAFFKMGLEADTTYKRNFNERKVYRSHLNSSDKSINYELTTLVFPACFKGFALTQNEATRTGIGYIKDSKYQGAFAGCPLLHKVIFKGSSSSDGTSDLIIPVLTFAYNCSLRTIVFEERQSKVITFHTQKGNRKEPAIGVSAGRNKNDYRSEPGIQTIVLPNVSTSLRAQQFAFQGNSRAAIYLSGSQSNNLKGNNQEKPMDSINNRTNTENINSNWKLIGNESDINGQYIGYCFDRQSTANSGRYKPNYGLDQSIPVYENTHYTETIEESNILNSSGEASLSVEVGVGQPNKVVTQGKFVFVCKTENGNNVATLSKYLYDRFEERTDGKIRVPASVTVNDVIYNTTKIGESAFCAAYSDTDGNEGYDELTTVEVPDTIKSIEKYAFLRAYGITKITAYTINDGVESLQDDYTMPSSLTSIGKGAFMFTSIVKFLSIPSNCIFYENTTDDAYALSVFSNNLYLRHITFANNSSNYYETTTYKEGNCTSALYSKDASGNGYSYNKNRLLLVLNRDPADIDEESADYIKNGDTYTFNGSHKSNPFLYGAFRMGYWIENLKPGESTKSKNNTIDQALFCAICGRSANDKVAINSPLYLYVAATPYYNQAADLKSVDLTGATSLSGLAGFSFDGCEQLQSIRLGTQPDWSITNGLFKSVSNKLTFITPGENGNDIQIQGTLDLTNTGYKGIGKQTFDSCAAFTTLIAPAVDNFTIDENAFNSSAIQTLNLSKVTGVVTINKNAFTKSKLTSIIWPENAEVIINERAFEDCEELVNLTLPRNLKSMGNAAFTNCDKLASVKVGNENSSNNRVTINENFTTIPSMAFENCTKLDDVDFASMPTLTTLYDNSFHNTGTIALDGNVVFPSNITSITYRAFYQSKMTTILFQSNQIELGEAAFNNISNLTTVDFENPDCNWINPQNAPNLFSDCKKLSKLFLPSTFNLSNTCTKSYFWNATLPVCYFYGKYYKGATYSEIWREYKGKTYSSIYYYADTSADVLQKEGEEGAEVGAIYNTTTLFWTKRNGETIALGTCVSKDASGNVLFSSGYTLSSNGTVNEPVV